LAFCAGVVIAIAFEQIDYSPYGKTRAEGDYQRLQGVDSFRKEFHESSSLDFFDLFAAVRMTRVVTGLCPG
jgi:hypothetical protein